MSEYDERSFQGGQRDRQARSRYGNQNGYGTQGLEYRNNNRTLDPEDDEFFFGDLDDDFDDLETQENEQFEVAQVSEQEETLDVASLTTIEKLVEAVNRAAKELPAAVAEDLKAILSPTAIASMAVIFAAYAASHAAGIGFIADVSFILAGSVFLGWQIFDVVKDIIGFSQAINATTEEELDKAGKHLADAISTVGVDIVIGLLTKKAASKIKNRTNGIDDVAASADNIDDVNTGRASNLDNVNANQGRDVQRTPNTDVAESASQESPGFQGSGPAPGFIEISSGVKSTGAIENLNPNQPMDFVFDPVNKRFVVGSRKYPLGHDGIMDAAGRGIRNEQSAGGRIGRRDGVLYTDEWSGHYGDRWNDTLRQQFERFKQEFGLDIPHLGDHDVDHLTK